MAPPLQPTFAFLKCINSEFDFTCQWWHESGTYISDTFLKAKGCMSCMLSPLSHSIRAKLASRKAVIWAVNQTHFSS